MFFNKIIVLLCIALESDDDNVSLKSFPDTDVNMTVSTAMPTQSANDEQDKNEHSGISYYLFYFF